MNNLEIREADLFNTTHQNAIIEVLNAYAVNPMIGREPIPPSLHKQLIIGLQNHPTTCVLLAFAAELPVGLAVCFRGFSTFAAQPLLNIHDLAVLPAQQNQGIGRKLLAAVERKAIDMGCCKLTLEVHDNNTRARYLYSDFGFSSPSNTNPDAYSLFLSKTVSDR